MSGALIGFYLLQIYCLWSTGEHCAPGSSPVQPQASTTAAQWASTGGGEGVPCSVEPWLVKKFLDWNISLMSVLCVHLSNSCCGCSLNTLLRIYLRLSERACGLWESREVKRGGCVNVTLLGDSKACRSISQSLSSSSTTSSGIDFQQMEAEL